MKSKKRIDVEMSKGEKTTKEVIKKTIIIWKGGDYET
jgi:hypothetical protein